MDTQASRRERNKARCATLGDGMQQHMAVTDVRAVSVQGGYERVADNDITPLTKQKTQILSTSRPERKVSSVSGRWPMG